MHNNKSQNHKLRNGVFHEHDRVIRSKILKELNLCHSCLNRACWQVLESNAQLSSISYRHQHKFWNDSPINLFAYTSMFKQKLGVFNLIFLNKPMWTSNSIQHYVKVCLWLAIGLWFSPVSSTNKTDCHNIAEILLKVALNTINQQSYFLHGVHLGYSVKHHQQNINDMPYLQLIWINLLN